MQLDVLAVVVDVVAGVVDVEGNVLVLQVLLQPTLVRLATPQFLVHLHRYQLEFKLEMSKNEPATRSLSSFPAGF